MEPRDRLCTSDARGVRAGETAGLVRAEPRDRPADPTTDARPDHRQFARLPSWADAGNPHHHRGGVRAGAVRQARREAGAGQRGGAWQQGTARIPEVGAHMNVVGAWRDVVERLTPVPPEQRRGFLSLPPTREAHAGAHVSVAAFHQIEQVGTGATAVPREIRIAAWNLERCLYPDEAARILQRHGVTLALLTEMDVGVWRTGQVP